MPYAWVLRFAAAGGAGGAKVGDARQNHGRFRYLVRQRAGAVDDDAIRMCVAAGSARPDEILEQRSRWRSPDLLDKVPPASRWCMGSARTVRSGGSPMRAGEVEGDGC